MSERQAVPGPWNTACFSGEICPDRTIPADNPQMRGSHICPCRTETSTVLPGSERDGTVSYGRVEARRGRGCRAVFQHPGAVAAIGLRLPLYARGRLDPAHFPLSVSPPGRSSLQLAGTPKSPTYCVSTGRRNRRIPSLGHDSLPLDTRFRRLGDSSSSIVRKNPYHRRSMSEVNRLRTGR
jgi:hypothetical protein